MNAEEIYKKYIEPPVVEPEPEPEPFPNEAKNKWVMPSFDDPFARGLTAINSSAHIQEQIPQFKIQDIQVSVDQSSSFIPFVNIRVLYSVNGNWTGIATTQIRQDPLRYQGPGVSPELLDMATQRLINDISIEVRDRLIAKPLKEQLVFKMEELHRKGL